jgi:cleavage and polyadenylation specificity factor subunit 1
MNDETNDDDLRITRVSFCDPYICILRHDGSVVVLQLNKKSGELVEIASGDTEGKDWKSGCLFQLDSYKNPLALLMTSKGSLRVSRWSLNTFDHC